MMGTLGGLEAEGGVLECGNSVAGIASGSPSKRGFSGLKAMFCSGNLTSGEVVLSGESDSDRIGREVDMRWALLRRPSPILFLCVPPLDIVLVVYRDPLSCPYPRP